LTLLNHLYEDYLGFKKQQSNDNGRTQDISPMTHPPYDLEFENIGNGINFEQDFLEEEENLHFLNLGEPTLRRAMY